MLEGARARPTRCWPRITCPATTSPMTAASPTADAPSSSPSATRELPVTASSEIPTEHHTPPVRRQKSVVVVNTGDGKGKSSSAFGVVMRGVARDWQVAVVQFLKSGAWQVGEEKVCRERLGVDWFAVGEGFTWESDDLTEDEAVAQAGWAHAKALLEQGEHRLGVLDEIGRAHV